MLIFVKRASDGARRRGPFVKKRKARLVLEKAMKQRAPARRSSKEAVGAPRRVPQQDRSRARVDAILRTTVRLVGEGRDVSVREIAEAAKVPIASVYQYFPDKTALLRAVMVGFYARIRARMEAALAGVHGIEDVPAFADAMIDEFVTVVGAPDAHFNLWAASQAQKTLRELDVKEALHLVDLVCARLLESARGLDADAVRDLCVFAVVMAGPAVRQSFVLPKRDGQRLVRELKAMIRVRAERLAGSCPSR